MLSCACPSQFTGVAPHDVEMYRNKKDEIKIGSMMERTQNMANKMQITILPNFGNGEQKDQHRC